MKFRFPWEEQPIKPKRSPQEASIHAASRRKTTKLLISDVTTLRKRYKKRNKKETIEEWAENESQRLKVEGLIVSPMAIREATLGHTFHYVDNWGKNRPRQLYELLADGEFHDRQDLAAEMHTSIGNINVIINRLKLNGCVIATLNCENVISYQLRKKE